MNLPGRILLRVFTDFDKGLAGGNHLFTQIAGGGADIVARHNHHAQLVMIAKQ
ncbi:hypothetical protein D3C85_1522480 [compost metagenome]